QRDQEIEAVPVGQDQVEDHQIRLAGTGVRLPQRGRLGNGESVALQGEGQTLADGGLVVDDQDARRIHGGAPKWPGFSGSFCGGGAGCFSSPLSSTASTNLLLRDSTTRSRADAPRADRSGPSRACSTRIHLRAPGPLTKSCSDSAGAGRATCRTVFFE